MGGTVASGRRVLTSELSLILDSAYEARHDNVLCLLGKPGIGKTQQLYQFAESKGVKVVEIIASQILPNEVSGITMPVNETHSMEIYDHTRLSSLEDGDILFFDELLQASPQTLSACLTLIQERRLMSGKMLPDIMIVAAANELPSATMIPMQIRQRFLFVNVEWDFEAWRKFNEKKYRTKIPGSMKSCVSFNDTGYNTLTPRTLSKLISWRSKVADEKVYAWRTVVEAEFGAPLADKINELFLKVPIKVQLQDALNDALLDKINELTFGDDELLKELSNNWDTMSMKEIYNNLQKLSCWDEIMAKLSKTYVEE